MNLFGVPTVEFCEKAGTGIIKRPFYALSNLAYIFVGLIILNKKTRLSRAFGLTSLLIGLLSLFYDASNTYLSQLLDLVGMLLFVNLLIYLSSRRYSKISKNKLILAQSLFVLIGLIAIIYFKSFAGGFVFGGFVIAEIVLELLLLRQGKSINIKLWLWGLGLFILGFLVWLPDASGWLCDPRNIINGRSIFHFLTAGTIYLLYQYFELQTKLD